MKSVIELARQVWGESAILPLQDLERLAALIKQQVIDELIGVDVRPVSHQYYGSDCEWKNFHNESHYKNTIENGGWEIRLFHTDKQLAAAVLQERERAAKYCKTQADYYEFDTEYSGALRDLAKEISAGEHTK